MQKKMRAMLGGTLLALVAAQAQAANFATCVVENMAGVKNAMAYTAALNICSQRFPDKFYEIRRGSARGLLNNTSPDQCTLEKTKDTAWQPAAALIKQSCDCLYTKSNSSTDMCMRYRLPAEILGQHTYQNDEQLLNVETHYRKIYAAHPDADALFASKSFQAWWVNDKAKTKILTSGTTQQIIRLMSEYKTQNSGLTPFTGQLDAQGGDKEWWKKGSTPLN